MSDISQENKLAYNYKKKCLHNKAKGFNQVCIFRVRSPFKSRYPDKNVYDGYVRTCYTYTNIREVKNEGFRTRMFLMCGNIFQMGNFK